MSWLPNCSECDSYILDEPVWRYGSAFHLYCLPWFEATDAEQAEQSERDAAIKANRSAFPV